MVVNVGLFSHAVCVLWQIARYDMGDGCDIEQVNNSAVFCAFSLVIMWQLCTVYTVMNSPVWAVELDQRRQWSVTRWLLHWWVLMGYMKRWVFRRRLNVSVAGQSDVLCQMFAVEDQWEWVRTKRVVIYVFMLCLFFYFLLRELFCFLFIVLGFWHHVIERLSWLYVSCWMHIKCLLFIDWLTGWLTDWLTGWLAGWLAGWLTGWLADW